MAPILGNLLIADHDEIIHRWYLTWRQVGPARPDISEVALKDLAPVQLSVIGEALQKPPHDRPSPSELWKVAERLYPEERVIQRMPIEEIVHEYWLLLDTVRKWIESRDLEVTYKDFTYLYECIFELVAESVRRYANYQAELIRKDRAEYLAGLTHQMRGPLAAISLNARRLRARNIPAAEEPTDAIDRNAKRLLLLVNGVMRLERFSPEEIPIHPEPFYPAQIVDQILDNNLATAEQKEIRLEASVDRTAKLSADPDLFYDAMGNLVQNAVKHTESGLVRVEMEELPDHLLFRVHDTGPGIPEEQRSKLFSGPVRPGKRGSAGLGLAIAHRAVTAQGGEIGIKSEEGKGATFWFTLPRKVEKRE